MSDRAFGMALCGASLVLGLFPLVLGKSYKVEFLVAAVTLLLIAVGFPRLLTLPKQFWLHIANRISQGVNFVVMATVFYGIVTPLALFFRLIRRDLLRRRIDRGAPSYWVKRPKPDPVVTNMKYQF